MSAPPSRRSLPTLHTWVLRAMDEKSYYSLSLPASSEAALSRRRHGDRPERRTFATPPSAQPGSVGLGPPPFEHGAEEGLEAVAIGARPQMSAAVHELGRQQRMRRARIDRSEIRRQAEKRAG